jgi:hypothetical protein
MAGKRFNLVWDGKYNKLKFKKLVECIKKISSSSGILALNSPGEISSQWFEIEENYLHSYIALLKAYEAEYLSNEEI